MSWRGRNGRSPRSDTNVSSSGRGSPSRLVRALTVSMAGLTVDPVRVPRSRARANLGLREEERTLDGRILHAVRAVHDVLVDAQSQVRPDGSGRGLLRIGRAPDFAVVSHGVAVLQHL